MPRKMVIVRLKIIGKFSFGPFDLSLLNLGFNQPNDPHGHLVLQFKCILQFSNEPVSPQMPSFLGLDELTANADMISALANASFEEVAHASSRPICRRSTAFPLYVNDGVACGYEQGLKLREVGN
jgi:hypothetical protein